MNRDHYLITAPCEGGASRIAQAKEIEPDHWLYVSLDKCTRHNILANRAGYASHQLIGSFTPEEKAMLMGARSL